ncbi:flagellar type III secretion system pore protein FliP [Salipiger sp. PrR003]|uniref:flagellar type III secretion system pore protein FliP n=1 Tax=Salipiger sp. PrR003 TaxID=2706776 RepID=UPI0013D98F76|nr:flagellar type III secretion system pore protein FliP [Salipiger sp. PrR003]NDV50794.1 flagellar type III secretion system pore protein FliP [Salipiger sp. PrR003]
MNRLFHLSALILGATLIAQPAGAQEVSGLLRSAAEQLSGSNQGTTELSGRILQMIALMTVLSIAPGLLVLMTSFTRFVIVFSMLRSALGLNQTPPNMVLSSLALFMTFFVMQPVFNDAWEGGLKPLLEDSITEEQALERVSEPFKAFMFANTREKDLQLFQDIAKIPSEQPTTLETAGWRELMPAFVISELRRAFTIGFLMYLPFIVIDLIVASVLMSAGMMMLPPVMISLPFKVIFFVLADGWYMLAGSLIDGYMPMAGG